MNTDVTLKYQALYPAAPRTCQTCEYWLNNEFSILPDLGICGYVGHKILIDGAMALRTAGDWGCIDHKIKPLPSVEDTSNA